MTARARRCSHWLLAGTILLTVAVSRGRTMQIAIAGAPGQNASRPVDRGLDPNRPDDEVPFGNREIQARQLRRLREEHQKQVFADTARLLQLATTLKEEADKEADKGAKPSPSAMKELDEITKLAKRLSERIKNQ